MVTSASDGCLQRKGEEEGGNAPAMIPMWKTLTVAVECQK